MISFDNLFKLNAESLGLEVQEPFTLVSHAHTDHLPTSFKKNKIICSDLTQQIIQHKKKLKTFNKFSHDSIEMLDAGHILGSSMFLINKEFLYTGDFNTQGDFCGKALPIKCKTLIMECTYGKPEYIFPSKNEVAEQLKEYIQKHEKVIISTLDVSFGKPQEVCSMLNSMKIPFTVNPFAKRLNTALGLSYKYEDAKASVILTNKYDYENYGRNFKKVILTGWAKNPSFTLGYDKGFIFSSHADYPSLIEFVRGCNPEKVYTHHGPEKEFAQDLRKLGFDAYPLSSLTQQKNAWWKRKRETQLTL